MYVHRYNYNILYIDTIDINTIDIDTIDIDTIDINTIDINTIDIDTIDIDAIDRDAIDIDTIDIDTIDIASRCTYVAVIFLVLSNSISITVVPSISFSLLADAFLPLILQA